MHARGLARVALIVGALVAVGCVGIPSGPTDSLRLSEFADAGDATFRASQRLVLEGLATRGRRAQGLFERALQLDSGNPYAYLALARHHVETGEPKRALGHLRRATDFLHALGAWSPRVEVHVVGLRGAALLQLDRDDEAAPLLAHAARAAPEVWSDGALSAAELR